jgi:hypothetical protein
LFFSTLTFAEIRDGIDTLGVSQEVPIHEL